MTEHQQSSLVKFLSLREMAFFRGFPNSIFPSHYQEPETSWFQGRQSSTGCRIVVSFLLVSAAVWVRPVHISWHERLVPAHWLVDLVLGPLVGRVLSRDMFRGSLGSRKSLITGAVFCPVGHLAWSYKLLVGARSSCQNSKCPPPARGHVGPSCIATSFQQPPTSPGDLPRPIGRSEPGPCEVTTFAVGLSAC